MRPADEIFLKLAVERGALGPEDARDVEDELARFEAEGQPTKARLLCIELGFMSKQLAREIKREVREVLAERADDGSDVGREAATARRRPSAQQAAPQPQNDATRSVAPVAETERRKLEPHLEASAEIGSRGQRRIAGFELLERLGAGAMGAVYKAKHLGLQEVVALKLMNPEFARDEKYVARFTQEAQVAYRLNHPNIVRAFDVGRAGDIHYLAMEFVEGKTVKELIDKRGKLEEAAAIEMVLQLLDALKCAHSQNLVHRDIKPANIMITKDGQAKLLDLGLAKRTDVENGLTGEGRAIGTPYFMAPEAALDRGADYRTDMYSLGVTFFNMVTGSKPYEASTPVAVMNMHLKAPIPDVREKNPRLSEGLARIIKKMMAKRPADRYQDHALLGQDLEAVLRGLMPDCKGGQTPQGIEYIKSRPTSGKGGRRKETERKSSLALVGAAAAVAVVAVGGFLFSQLTPRAEAVEVATAATAVDPAADAEDRARVAFSDASAAPQGRARADELSHVANQFPSTQAGHQARAEADKIFAELAAKERLRFESRRSEIEAIASGGRLHDARVEWEALARTLDDVHLTNEARDRADALSQEIQRRLAEAEVEVAGLVEAGDEPGAGRVLRETLPLRPSEEHEAVAARVEQLRDRFLARKAEAKVQARSEAEQSARQNQELVAALPGKLRERVRAEDLPGALTLAREAGAKVAQDQALLARVRLHRQALEAAAGLQGLAESALRQLVGQEVRLECRQGRELSGTLVAVAEGRLTVGDPGKAERTEPLAALAEAELLRMIRRVHGGNHVPYLHGLAALKLYRGDADATDQLAKAKAVGVDLAALVDELREPEAAQEEVQGLVAEGLNEPADDQDQAIASARQRNDEERARFEKHKRWADGRAKLFPDTAAIGFTGSEFQLAYTFEGRRAFGRDWALSGNGKAAPTPPGQERTGLVLEGKQARAELQIPFQRDVVVKVRLQPQMISSSEGRFAITLDDAQGGRVSCELGQLFAFRKRKPVGSAGERSLSRLRAKELHILELVRRGDVVTSILDGEELARLPIDPALLQGPVEVGLEWGHAALNLLTIELEGAVDEAWLEKRLGNGSK